MLKKISNISIGSFNPFDEIDAIYKNYKLFKHQLKRQVMVWTS